jgi:hypothetical protein
VTEPLVGGVIEELDMRRLLAITLLVAACGGPAGTATPAVGSGPTAAASAQPEPSPAGPGRITFGTAYDRTTLEITEPHTRFLRTYPAIAWSAAFREPVGPGSITLVIARRSRAGVEETLHSEELLVDPTTTILVNTTDLASMVDNEPDTYVMRYVRSVTVLAEGAFVLVE